jgi:MHS family proline/betaine transporter-like MFS transporter
MAGNHQRSARRRVVVAGIAGNVMEWYDFAIYGYFARTIGKLYFPADNQTATLLAAFGVFAVGFMMRPLGAVFFGYIGDRVGRGPALLWSVVAMAVPTLGIGLLPSYDQIGIAAPLLMLLFRIFQGLAVGGEYTASAVFLAETADENRRGFASAWAPFGAVAGILLGSAVGAVVLNGLTAEQIVAWGWRLPFLFGVVVGGVGFILRRRMAFDKPAATHGFPLAGAVRGNGREMLMVMGLSLVNAVGFYLTFVYVVTWLRLYANVKAAVALQINTVNMAIMLAVILASAWLSDRIGRKPILVAAALGLTLLSWPLMAAMRTGDVWVVFLGQFGLTFLIGAYGGVIPATMCEMFPKAIRCSAVSTAYNITVGIAGGTAPMAATWLIDRTGYSLAPAIYMMLSCALSAVAAFFLVESSKRRLEEHGVPALAVAEPG